MLSRTKRKKSIKNLKKFKKAKFNYAKFVKKYYIEKGEAYISAKVNSIDDIISKYSTKVIFNNSFNHVFFFFRKITTTNFNSNTFLKRNIVSTFFNITCKFWINPFIIFGLKLGDKFLDLDINKHKSFILFLFGIISLGVFAILSNFSIITAVNELLLLLFWFFLWEYADLGWLTRGNLRLEQIEAGQLSTAKIVFLDE